jgi:hypothetical protein
MHIASDFLQTKWYPGDPQTAGAGKYAFLAVLLTTVYALNHIFSHPT